MENQLAEKLDKLSISANKDTGSNLLNIRYTSSSKDLHPLHQVLLSEAGSSDFKYTSPTEIFTEEIDSYTSEYSRVNIFFKKSCQKHMKVVSIRKVFNLFAHCFYLLKKEEYTVLHGQNKVKEHLLFHGTKNTTVDIIIKTNFDWRKHGTSKGNIFGRGVSFSPFSSYASNYCYPEKESRIMIIAKVLQAESCIGNQGMIIPPEIPGTEGVHYDTTIKPDGGVVVKYCDNEFYPAYLVCFDGYTYRKY